MDFNYDQVLKYAYRVAVKYINNHDTAQDIAQLSAIQLFVNRDKIDPEKLDNWLYTVTKNFCFTKYKISQKNKEVIFEPDHLESMKLDESEDQVNNLDFFSYDFIKKTDQELLHKYYNEHFKISDLAKAYKVKKKRIQAKIYRLTQEIILFKKMKDHVFTSSISGTKLHNSIYYFLGKFVKALNENTLTEFSESLSDCIINDCIKDIEIKTIRKITVDFLSEYDYRFLIIYRNFADELRVFIIKFQIVEGKRIKILEFPILPKYVVSHSVNEIPDELKKAQKLNKRGKTNVEMQVFKDLVKQKKIKVVQDTEGIFDS